MKPYQSLPIQECGDPLVAIPTDLFHLTQPHPYQVLGAPYGDVSPFFLRQEVIRALVQAQTALSQQKPGWRLSIFDAYRPVAVQQFMVDYSYATLLADRGLDPETLTDADKAALWDQVLQLWALPSVDSKTPPPHSTGAAVDLTLVDETGTPVDMGSEIDELSERSHPDYFAKLAADPAIAATTRALAQRADDNRQLLNQVMQGAGFQRHWGEWWHFCLGDQMWAWLSQQQGQSGLHARYGRADLLNVFLKSG